MTDGQRWLAIDADLMGKPFILDLYHQFGWAGIGVWVAFLCACKRSRTPGMIRFLNEPDALAQLGLLGLDLIDNYGKEWALADFWTFTGRKKQTRRTSRGRETNVRATHWGHWQKRTSQGKNAGHARLPRGRADLDLDLDLDKELPKSQAGGDPPDPESTSRTNGTNPRARGTNPRANGTNPRAKAAEARRELVPDWQPDPEPEEPPIDRAAVQALRNHRQPDQP